MEVSNFKIFNASAGSGKTYTLSKAYLKLLLSSTLPLNFRQLLAITFTNKAVSEMKTRILDNLHAFASIDDLNNGGSLFNDLCKDLDLKPNQLKQRSQVVLKRILHNYSYFEISTIDRFNHKIIKTFARDLQLAQNFEVELDTDLLLEQAVGKLLERVGTDQELTNTLIEFSFEKIDDDKNWNISRDLMEIGKLLFQENHAPHIEKLRSKSILEFEEIQRNLIKQIKKIEKIVTEIAEDTLKNIQALGFEPIDFPRQTLPNHFKKIKDKEYSTKVLYANKLEQNLNENKVLKSGDKRDALHLSQTVLKDYSQIKEQLFRRNYLKNIYSNIVPLTVLNEISKEIKNIENENDVIPISSLNTILSNEIKNQPVPFIYERLGEKYRHYFIDEFQDTSQMQWENLIPLISNALESEDEKKKQGTLFLVGDVKQAIYRWRGGKAEQFLNLLNLKSHAFTIAPHIQTLKTNWRSYNEIVDFNNSFFTCIAPFLKDTDYQNLFLQSAQQKSANKSGGFVQLSFVNDNPDQKEKAYCDYVLQCITEVKSKKFNYSDICILVRKNSHGMLLANYLAENNIPIVSSESLLLENNDSVAFLISLLKVIENESDTDAAYEVLSFLAPTESDKHDFIQKHLRTIEHLFLQAYGFNIPELKNQPVLNILETAILQFDLPLTSSAHITFLMDTVLEIEKKDGPGIHSFIQYWELKKESLSLAAPESLNAVKIMTVHKSKGLEFPVVIFPFANMVIDDKRKKKKSWVSKTNDGQDLELEEFLINNNKDMLEYSSAASSVYLDEVTKTELDAFNVLYVALTRAKKALYIISETSKKIVPLENANTYSDLFQHYLQKNDIYNSEKKMYDFGTLSENDVVLGHTSTKHHFIPYTIRSKQAKPFNISTKSSSLWDEKKLKAVEAGNLIHLALSMVEVIDDVPQVIENLIAQGHLQEKDREPLHNILNKVTNHPKLKKYYTSKYKIVNEKEILTKDGESLRPDRLAILDNNITIIDYKTGKPSPKHKEQISFYAKTLKNMGYTIQNTIIIYIENEINPLFL